MCLRSGFVLITVFDHDSIRVLVQCEGAIRVKKRAAPTLRTPRVMPSVEQVAQIDNFILQRDSQLKCYKLLDQTDQSSCWCSEPDEEVLGGSYV